jgi:VWFA-related protein
MALAAAAGVQLLLCQTPPTIRVNVEVVTVACSVTDRNGAPVPNLTKDDFVLNEDGVPQSIKYLWQEVDLPLTVGLIVDVSGSQMGLVSRHRQTVADFLARVLGPRDRAFLVTVGPRVMLLTDLTGEVADLRAGVERIDMRQRSGAPLGDPCRRRRLRSCGGTVLWNGVFYAARLKMRPLEGRKALIVLSDGLDTGSDHNLTAAIEAAQGADTLVYTIKHVSKAAVAMSPTMALLTAFNRSLRKLAEETGGRAFPAPRDGPAEIFSQIEDELRSLYVLGFTPAAPSREGFHKIEVQTRQPGLKVRARKGYQRQ